ncbi:MAG: WS/DGAT/MGAT family O-acyltransferase, partial [Ilumatobacteraceae bacterium]
MRQLNGIDVSFLNMETPTTFGHVSSVTIYDPSGAPGGAGIEATKEIILERIDQLAPFRRRLVEVPLGLDLPYWIEDPHFDIDFHVRHHAIPAPGNAQQLSEAVSRIIARPLDRTRPLWELYVIEGLEGGRIAQLTKVHHAAIDGAAGAMMLAALLDMDPAARPSGSVAHWEPEEIPSDEELLRITAREYLRRPEKMIRLTVRTARELAAATRSGGMHALADLIAQPMPGPVGAMMRERLRAQRGADVDKPPALPPTQAPRTPWNRPITPHRRFAYTSVPLEDAKIVRRAFGCTFNDVVMAVCSGTLRRYLQLHDCLPEESLVAMVPVSVRSGSEDDSYQNRVSALFSDLATNEPDPGKRIHRVQQSMQAAKEQFAAIPAEALQDFTQFAPPAVAARAMRMYSQLRIADRMNPPFNLVISNVPGPQIPLYSSGARLEHFYPVSTLVDGQGLNMTVQSYDGNLDFGFVADRDLVPDLWVLTDLLHQEMAELVAIAQAAVRPLAADDAAAAKAAKAPKAGRPKQTAKAPAKTAPAKKAPAKKAPAKKAAAKKAAAKKAPAKKAAAKKA